MSNSMIWSTWLAEALHQTTMVQQMYGVANPSNGYAFVQGPSMITGRYYHSCGTMSIGTKSIIIGAGGYEYPYHLSSVEILDPQSNQWVVGK